MLNGPFASHQPSLDWFMPEFSKLACTSPGLTLVSDTEVLPQKQSSFPEWMGGLLTSEMTGSALWGGFVCIVCWSPAVLMRFMLCMVHSG